MSLQQADKKIYQSKMEIREKMIFFVNRSLTKNFQCEIFSGRGLLKLPRTQISDYLYERGVENF